MVHLVGIFAFEVVLSQGSIVVINNAVCKFAAHYSATIIVGPVVGHGAVIQSALINAPSPAECYVARDQTIVQNTIISTAAEGSDVANYEAIVRHAAGNTAATALAVTMRSIVGD